MLERAGDGRIRLVQLLQNRGHALRIGAAPPPRVALASALCQGLGFCFWHGSLPERRFSLMYASCLSSVAEFSPWSWRVGTIAQPFRPSAMPGPRTCRRKAFPRWLSRFFSSRVSSANVLPSSGAKKIGSYPNPPSPRGCVQQFPCGRSRRQSRSRVRVARAPARKRTAPRAPPRFSLAFHPAICECGRRRSRLVRHSAPNALPERRPAPARQAPNHPRARVPALRGCSESLCPRHFRQTSAPIHQTLARESKFGNSAKLKPRAVAFARGQRLESANFPAFDEASRILARSEH